VNTANNIGAAGGASAAGVLIETVGPTSGFLAGGAILVLAAFLVSFASRR